MKLQKENPDGLYQANSPDFQDALFTVQKEHAKAGDEDLGSLLVDLLVDRTKETSRSTLQIVLNESLHVAPKLTSMHLAVLAVVFFFRYTRNPDIGNFNLLAQYLSNHMETFSDLLPKNEGAFQHLQFTGCGSTSMGSISLENIFRLNFGGLFNKGFEENRLLELPITLLGSNRNFFVPCINDLSKLQVRSVDLDSLKNHLIVNSVSNEDQQKMEFASAFENREILWWNNQIQKLNEDKNNEKNQRLLGYISLAAWSYSSKSVAINNTAFALKALQIYKLADPENPEQAFITACLYSKNGKQDSAIYFLKEAVRLGLDDRSKIEKEKDLFALHERGDFQEVIGKMFH